MAKIIDKNTELLGFLYRGNIELDGRAATITWVISKAGVVLNLKNYHAWQNTTTRAFFVDTVGKTFSDTTQCNNGAELVALEVLTTSQFFVR